VPSVRKCLLSLNSIASGTATKRTAQKAKITQALLSKEAGSFEFLARLPISKLRSRFYSILGKLLFCEANRKYTAAFMHQFDGQFKDLDQNSRSEILKLKATGLCRDLTGILDVAEARQDYKAMFKWVYPHNLQMLVRILETWWDEGQVVNPLLKLVASLVHNKQDRIHFPKSSANGIRLFKEASKIVTMYCSQITQFQHDDAKDSLEVRVKGLQLCLSILTRALSGNYVCFEVFDMYRDQCVNTAVTALLKPCLSLGTEVLGSHKKLFRKLCDFLAELFTPEHMKQTLAQSPEMIHKMLLILIDGLCSDQDKFAVSASAGAFDNLFGMYYMALKNRNEDRSGLNTRLRLLFNDARCKATLSNVVGVLMNLVIFGSSKHNNNLWGLSRPMATSIAVDTKAFLAYRNRFVQAQVTEHRDAVDRAFSELVAEVEFDISYHDKNRFTKNLCRFVQHLKGLSKVVAVM